MPNDQKPAQRTMQCIYIKCPGGKALETVDWWLLGSGEAGNEMMKRSPETDMVAAQLHKSMDRPQPNPLSGRL